jgi:hypothetical protein
MSHTQQHNLHFTYREILNKPGQAARLEAFVRFLDDLLDEELDYIDGLLERDLGELLPEECLDRVDSLLHLRFTQEMRAEKRLNLR